jgi:hypothetical protein
MLKFVKPKNESDVVFNPDTKRKLPKEGEEVGWSTYWQRRQNAGEIEVSEVPVKPEPKKAIK